MFNRLINSVTTRLAGIDFSEGHRASANLDVFSNLCLLTSKVRAIIGREIGHRAVSGGNYTQIIAARKSNNS